MEQNSQKAKVEFPHLANGGNSKRFKQSQINIHIKQGKALFVKKINKIFEGPNLGLLHEPGPAIAGTFKGKIGGDGTCRDARCSTSSARASHPRSLGGLRRAWRRSPPEKGLPTLRRAYLSRTDLASAAEQGLLLEAPGGGLAGYDSGGALAGSELIAPWPGNESPRGN